jgi:SAM-dependent methyltransferase
MTEHSSHADLQVERRLPKAEKIRLLLEASFVGGKSPRLLEIGTGSGVIAQFFSAMGQCRVVHAVDVSDQRQVHGGYVFQLFDGHRLPFADGEFDVVLSNHVIEHVGGRGEQARHLGEISRLLAPGGQAYLASPSRWQVVEPHFRLPFLSWIPRRYRDGYVRIAGKGERYDCDPMGHEELEKLLTAHGLRFRNANVAALRAMALGQPDAGRMLRLATRLPSALLQRFYRMSPTMIYVLEKPIAGLAAGTRVGAAT